MGNRSGTDNLIPFDKMPRELHLELSAKGGRASGEKRKAKAALKKSLLEELERQAILNNMLNEYEAFTRWRNRRSRAKK